MLPNGDEVVVVEWDDVKARPVYKRTHKHQTEGNSGKNQTSKSRRKLRAPAGSSTSSSTDLSSSVKSYPSDAEIFESKSSYDDFEFLRATLQRWSESGQGVGIASIGLNVGCFIVIPQKWTFEHRASFARWATISFGFRTGSVGGVSGSSLKCSDSTGKEALARLQRILECWKAGRLTSSKAKAKVASYPQCKRGQETIDVGIVDAISVPSKEKKKPRWLSGSPTAGYGKKRSKSSPATVKPVSDLSSPDRKLKRLPRKSEGAATTGPCSNLSSSSKKQKSVSSKSLKVDYGKKRYEVSTVVGPSSSLSSSSKKQISVSSKSLKVDDGKKRYEASTVIGLSSSVSTPTKNQMASSKSNIKSSDKERSKSVAIVSPWSSLSSSAKTPTVYGDISPKSIAAARPCSVQSALPSKRLEIAMELEHSKHISAVESNQSSTLQAENTRRLQYTVEEQKKELECLRKELRVTFERHAVEATNHEAKLRSSFAMEVEHTKGLAKMEVEAEVERVKHDLNAAHAKYIAGLKLDLEASHRNNMEHVMANHGKEVTLINAEKEAMANHYKDCLENLTSELESSIAVGEKQRNAEIEHITNELNGAHTQAIEGMRNDKERAEQQLHSTQRKKEYVDKQLAEREVCLQKLEEKHEAELSKQKKTAEELEKSSQADNRKIQQARINQRRSKTNFSKLQREKQQVDKKLADCESQLQELKSSQQRMPNKGSSGDDAAVEKQQLRNELSGAIMKESPNVTWDCVAGLEEAKESLKDAVILPQSFPQLFKGKRSPCKSILLYGPPGTGKSYLAKAVATEAGCTFYSVSGSDLVSKWQGESERLIRNLFEMAREDSGSRAIVFIDEVDSLCATRQDGECDSARRIKTEFLVQMDGVGNQNNTSIFVLGATNHPWELDPAMRRRFKKRVYIGMPGQNARATMVKIHLGDTPNNISEHDFDTLGQLSEGASGSDIEVLVQGALMEPVKKCKQARQFLRFNGGYLPCEKYPNCEFCLPKLKSPTDPPNTKLDCSVCGAKQMRMWDNPSLVKAPDVCMKDFKNVLRHSYSTVSKEEVEKYASWTKLFGQTGE